MTNVSGTNLNSRSAAGPGRGEGKESPSSLPRYAEYKDSGVKWLGKVPAHWESLKVKAFTQFCGGGTPSRDNLAFWNGDIPWVSPKDMKFERIKGAEEYITDEGLSSSSSSLVDSGRLLMVVRSGILKHTIPVAINDVPVALNQDMKALRFKEQLATSEFFLRWVQGLNDALLLAWAKQGATVESIEHNYLAETLVPLPPLSEQSVIATFLDRETGKIDALIAEQEKLLTLLAEKRQATISYAVTRGLNPNAPMKDSGVPWLGDVPAHWDVCPLKYISRIGNGSTPNRDNPGYWNESGFPWLNSSVVNQDEVTEAERFVTELALKECHLPVVQPPAVLVGITGQGKTRGMAAPLLFEATINQHLAYIKPERGRLQVAYLLRAMEMAYEHLRVDSEGAGSTKGAITCDQLSRFAIPLPPLDEQDSIASHLDVKAAQFDRLASDSRQTITLLKERRSALIAAAVTGKIDVRQAA